MKTQENIKKAKIKTNNNKIIMILIKNIKIK
jgi:hypothetical protein